MDFKDILRFRECGGQQEVVRILTEAKKIDAEEDALFGFEHQGDGLPEGAERRTERRLQEAKSRLEKEADDTAKAGSPEAEADGTASGKKNRGRKP